MDQTVLSFMIFFAGLFMIFFADFGCIDCSLYNKSLFD